MSFRILCNVVSENYSEHYFPAVWRGRSSYLSFHYHIILYDVTFPFTDIILQLMLPLSNPDSGSRLQNQHVATKTATTDQTVIMPAGIHKTPLSSLK